MAIDPVDADLAIAHRDTEDAERWSPWRVAAGLAIVGLAVGLLWVLWAWQQRIWDSGGTVKLGAAPLFGLWETDWAPELLVAAVGGLALVIWWPRLTRTLGWGVLLACSWLVSLGWTLAINLPGGWTGLGTPLDDPHEYLYTVRNSLTDPLLFLSRFVDQLRSYPIHVQGHPPGPVIGLEALQRLGIRGASGTAFVLVAVACLASPLVLIAVRALTTEREARRAAVFVGLTPSVLWVATSVDAVFAAVAVASGTALALAAVRSGAWVRSVDGRWAAPDAADARSAWAGGLMALLGGIFAGLLVLGTYGAPLFLVPGGLCLALLVWRRRWLPAGLAVLGAGLPVALMAWAGFWLLDGFRVTVTAYHEGIASQRPGDFFRLSNLLALAISVGPIVLVSLPGRRRVGAWILVGGVLAGLAAAEVSGLSKGEVERIWLPLVPWLTVATAAIPIRWQRPALAVQLASGIALAATFASPW